jgi:hypothetical protein
MLAVVAAPLEQLAAQPLRHDAFEIVWLDASPGGRR